MKRQMSVRHKNLIKIRFEDLVRRPQATARKLYEDLGLKFEEKQRKWVQDHFGKHPDCEETALSTCKKDSMKSLKKWVPALKQDTDAVLDFGSTDCQDVLRHYAYEKEDLVAI